MPHSLSLYSRNIRAGECHCRHDGHILPPTTELVAARIGLFVLTFLRSVLLYNDVLYIRAAMAETVAIDAVMEPEILSPFYPPCQCTTVYLVSLAAMAELAHC